MKCRSGFVSNSSSSSFIIGSKVPLTEELLLKHFGVKEGSLMYPFAIKTAKWIVEYAEHHTLKDYLMDMGFNDLPKDVAGIFDKGMKLYIAWAHSDSHDNSIEAALCDLDFHYESDELIIEKEGGY